MRRSTNPMVNTGTPRTGYSLAGWVIASVSLLLAIMLLILSWLPISAMSGLQSDENAGVVFLLTANSQSNGQYRLLAAGLTACGFQVLFHPMPEDHSSSASATLEELIDRHDDSSDVWLAATGDEALPAWRLSSQLSGISGAVLLAPSDLESLTDHDYADWPKDRTMLIISSADGSAGYSARNSFEMLSGEDASLFPAYRSGPLGPLQYASADGKTWLFLYNGLSPSSTLASVRVLPDLLGWFTDWSAATGQSAVSADDSSSRLMLVIFQLIAASLLLLAVPAGLSLAMLGSSVLNLHPEDSAYPSRPDILGAIGFRLLWIPAVLAAAAIGLALSWLSRRPGDWLQPALLLLPGCRGWLAWGSRLAGRRRQNISDEASLPPRMLLSQRSGLLMVVLTLTAAVVWIWQLFGSLLPGNGWPPFWLPILMAISWPAGFAGTPGQIGERLSAGLSPNTRWFQSIDQHIPFAAFLIWTAFTGSSAGLISASLLLVIELWAVSMGKAAALLSCRPAIGSLVQAASWSLIVLIPVVF